MVGEVVVERARSREEMGEPVPRPERTAERLPRAQRAGSAVESEGHAKGGDLK